MLFFIGEKTNDAGKTDYLHVKETRNKHQMDKKPNIRPETMKSLQE